jgi:hypothetical protein
MRYLWRDYFYNNGLVFYSYKCNAVPVLNYLSTMPRKRMGGSGGISVPFSTSALYGGELSASCPGRFTHGVTVPNTYFIGVWVGPKSWSGRCEGEKILLLPGIEPGRPARSPLLYLLFLLAV